MRCLVYIVGCAIVLATLVFLTILLVMPRMNWSATSKPAALESWTANEVRERWIALHSPDQKNPFASTPENLAGGRDEYNKYCAVCHGLDGSGRSRLGADFYPPVAHLTGDTQDMTDGEIYFVIVNGVALSAMPAFGERHNSEQIWKMVLWVRHLPNLTTDERKEMERETYE